MQLSLVIANKNYSSWSLRPWLAMKHFGLQFDEIRIPLGMPDSHTKIQQYSPSGKVPVLLHGNLVVWDSLAICEYLAEQFPEHHWWPQDATTRATARSIAAEMHSGFQNLRQQMPMNCRARRPGKGMTPEVAEDIKRITAIWRECLNHYSDRAQDSDGMLFGKFCIADAMFAPVVQRFLTYGVELDATVKAYVDVIQALPEMQEWLSASETESETIPKYELV